MVVRASPRPSPHDLSTVRVRQLSADAWPEWRRLRREALTESAHAFGSTLAEWSGAGDTEERWRSRLEDVAANYVADLEGVAVGMVSGTAVDDGEVEVISMWVAPPGRGLGVGAALIEAVVENARRQGASRVALDVTAANQPAIDLYLRSGFVDVGWATEPEDPKPERRMVLQL